MRVLVAEDKSTTLYLLEVILKNWGYDVVSVNDGKHALDQLLKPGAPRLAILDWKMPGIDGLEVIRAIRKIRSEDYIYAIVLTGKDSNDDLLEGMSAGADDYITKPFDPQELKVRLRAAERIISLQAELSEARRQEQRIAARMQNALLFGEVIHDLDWVENGVMAQPALEIGGDFYDFFRINDQCFDIVTGDVMGKGINAALVSAGTKNRLIRSISTLMISHTDGTIPRPGEIIDAVNADVTPELVDRESFITCAYGRFDNKEHILHLVDCGHVPVMKIEAATGKATLHKTQNAALGIQRDKQYEELQIPFASGDLFCFYTDGIIKARNRDEEQFGIERLTQTLLEVWQHSPRRILGHFVENLVEFQQGNAREDDMTFIAIKIR